MKNNWRNGPVFVMEIDFSETPSVYLSKYEYTNISNFYKEVSSTEHWGFSEPRRLAGDSFKKVNVNIKVDYIVLEPENEEIGSKYWGV